MRSQSLENDIHILDLNQTETTMEQTEGKKKKEPATVDTAAIRSEAMESERTRIKDINSMFSSYTGERFINLKDKMINEGVPVGDAGVALLDELKVRKAPTINPNKYTEDKELSTELRSYDLNKAIHGFQTRDFSSREAGLARELSEEVELSMPGILGRSKTASTMYVPWSAFLAPTNTFDGHRYITPQEYKEIRTGKRSVPQLRYDGTRATYVTSTDSSGGYLVQEDYQDLVAYLRQQTIAGELGVRYLSGLSGDMVIPSQTGKSTAYFLSSETSDITASEATFSSDTVSPVVMGILSRYSYLASIQSTPSIRGITENDLRETVTEALDENIMAGDDSNGPDGILHDLGSGQTKSLGTNGDTLTYADLIDLQEIILSANGRINRASSAYVTTFGIRNLLQNLVSGPSTNERDHVINYTSGLPDRITSQSPFFGGELGGFPIYFSNAMPSDLTKGTLTAGHGVLLGNFSEVSVGIWGDGLALDVGYTGGSGTGFQAGVTSVRALMAWNQAIRYKEAFARIVDAKTS